MKTPVRASRVVKNTENYRGPQSSEAGTEWLYAKGEQHRGHREHRGPQSGNQGFLSFQNSIAISLWSSALSVSSVFFRASLVIFLVLASYIFSLSAAESPMTRMERALLILEKDKPKALAELEALATQETNFLPGLYNLGVLLMNDDAERAAQCFKSACASEDDALSARAWHNLAQVRFKQGRLEDALAAASEGRRLHPQDKVLLQCYTALNNRVLAKLDAIRLKALEAAKRLRLEPQEILPLREGIDASSPLTATGGAGRPYRYAFSTSATIPTGLHLQNDTITGCPKTGTAGEHEIAIDLSDRSGAKITDTAKLLILEPLSITTKTLPAAIIEAPYQTIIEAKGTWQPQWLADGLPEGMSAGVSSQGLVLQGVPRSTSQATIRVGLKDHFGMAYASFPFQVIDGFAPAEAELEDATVLTPYQSRLTVRGRSGSFRWTSNGANGLSVSSEGIVEGSPLKDGPMALPFIITNENDGKSVQGAVSITVHPQPTIDEPQPISLEARRPAKRPIKGKDGCPPYHFRKTLGTLPDGLLLGEDGTIHGVPLTECSANITVEITDRWKATGSAKLQIVIEKPKEGDKKEEQKEQEKKDKEKKEQEKKEQDKEKQKQKQKEQDQQKEKGQDKQEKNQDKNQEKGKGQDQQNNQDKGQTKKNEPKESSEKQGEKEARERRGQASLERWLDSLPKDDRDALREHLLETLKAQHEQSDRDPW